MLAENDPPMGFDRKEIDNRILDELQRGRNVPSNLAEELDVTRQYIQQRLQLLEAADHIQNIGRGVYELVDDPRSDETPSEDADADADVEQYEDRMDDLEGDLAEARTQINDLREERDELEESLEAAPHPDDVALVHRELEDALERGDRQDIQAALSRLESLASN